MGCCKESVINSIIRQFSVSSPCCEELSCVIPAFWDMVSAEACGNCRLTALLTKRESVLFLLGCEAYSVDLAESHFSLIADTKADSRADSRTQSQATGSMNKKSEGHGETVYNEKSESNTVYDSKRLGRAEENTDGDSLYEDDGGGSGFNWSQSFSFIRNRLNHDVSGRGNSENEDSRIGNDCNYEYSTNNTNGWGTNAAIIATSFSGTASEWRKYQKTVSSGFGNRESRYALTGIQDDTGLTTSNGTHNWEDSFQADIDWYEKEFITRFHNERFDSRRNATAHADGAGNGMHEQKDESFTASQGTSQTVGDSETLRVASRVTNLSAFDITNSQRFTNLQNLYDQLTEQINHVRSRSIATSKPYINVMPCRCTSNCCCSPQLRERGLNVIMSNCRVKTCAPSSSGLWDTRIT